MPRQIHILFNLLVLFAITYIAVDIFYRVVTIELNQVTGQEQAVIRDVERAEQKTVTDRDYSMIVRRNIFGATEKIEPLVVEEELESVVEILEETTLQLSLLGTIAGDMESARAIILDERERRQDIYRVGDSVQEAEIRQILRGKVILRHDGRDEVLSMAEGDDEPQHGAKRGQATGRVTPRPGGSTPARTVSREVERSSVPEVMTIPVSQETLQNSMNDISELMTQVRVRPFFRRGQPEGLVVSQIQPDSVFSQLGLVNGDIISSVNGRKMSSPEEAFQFYSSLKSGEDVSIGITRRGQKLELVYEIE